MSELRINGYKSIADILHDLIPFIRFKKIQARALYTACTLLSKKSFKKLSRKEVLKIVDLILVIQSENYVTKKKKTKEELLKMLGLTP